MTPYSLIIRNIKIPLKNNGADDYDFQAIAEAKRIVKNNRFFSKLGFASFAVCKKSVDARKKISIFFIYSVICSIETDSCCVGTEEFEKQCAASGFTFVQNTPLEIINRKTKSVFRPIVVGFGPCGMFASLILARAGLRPIVLERGDAVDERANNVEEYWKNGLVNEESNVQFGEGGAGTFSDGKLLTRINDPLCNFVLETLHKHGADKDILINAKPHIGTDLLRGIVKSIRKEIESLGGEVNFRSRLDACSFNSDGKIVSLTVNNEKNAYKTDAMMLCIGHSARDTFGALISNGVKLSPKPFSVGVRIEHLQSSIDKALYGENAGNPALPKGEYALSLRDDNRAVYTFCMCPGGTVVASASEAGTIVTNGMSYNARAGINANSAVAVSVCEDDYGNSVQGAIDFQKRIEVSAFELAGADNSAPIMTVGDFLSTETVKNTVVNPTYTGKTKYRDIRQIFPQYVNAMLEKGLLCFNRKINGFADGGALLTAPETRTSSPVRIPRDELRCAIGYPSVYPCGEGAGYAGGITSAAADGIKTALAYLDSLE